ncbi:MAG TPA: glycosyltransferase family 2 protein [Patescibacteria group bacterium]|nr:glycosyltransferase family 2 protein [Patescibacteria group bacterium]
MKTQPTLSIIIVSYNTQKLLFETLNSIYKFDNKQSQFEVVVIDNASRDGSAKMVAEKFPKVKLIQNSRNLGFGRANNLAAKKSTGKYLFFLNSDTLVQKSALLEIIKFFDQRPKAGVLGPKLLLGNKQIQPFAAGNVLNLKNLIFGKFFDFWTRKLKWRTGLNWRDKFIFNLALPKKQTRVDWVSGAAMAVRKDLFSKLRGFDCKYFMYFEDQDLCLRAKKRGFQVWYLPQTKIIHLGGMSLKTDNKRKKLYYISQAYFIKKHFGIFQYWLWKILSLPIRTR